MTSLPFSLIVITDWTLGEETLLERLEASLAVAPGRIAVQHRHPGATDRERYEEGQRLAPLCARHQAPLFVNGRLDLALALGAHLHCTSSSLAPAQARPFLEGRWISTVVHQATDDTEAADLALVSPVFAPGSKPGDQRRPLGAAGYRQLAQASRCPAFALGGITAATLDGLETPGAAVISAVLHAADPAQATRALLARLRAS